MPKVTSKKDERPYNMHEINWFSSGNKSLGSTSLVKGLRNKVSPYCVFTLDEQDQTDEKCWDVNRKEPGVIPYLWSLPKLYREYIKTPGNLDSLFFYSIIPVPQVAQNLANNHAVKEALRDARLYGKMVQKQWYIKNLASLSEKSAAALTLVGKHLNIDLQEESIVADVEAEEDDLFNDINLD